jgi:hypothetical protein
MTYLHVTHAVLTLEPQLLFRSFFLTPLSLLYVASGGGGAVSILWRLADVLADAVRTTLLSMAAAEPSKSINPLDSEVIRFQTGVVSQLASQCPI